MQTVEQLKNKMQSLISEIKFKDRVSGNLENELKAIKELENQIYKLEAENAINSFNKENQRKKELLTLIFEAERLEKSYFKNDGYFSVNALKKLPNWDKIVELYKYIHVSFYSDSITIKVSRDTFYFKDSFNLSQFLEYNAIRADLTISDYIHLCREFEKLNKEFKDFSKNYSEKLTELRSYDFCNIGLMQQYSTRFHEFIPTKNFTK